MNIKKCKICGSKLTKYGKNKTGKQRGRCNKCKQTIVISNKSLVKDLRMFLSWLLSKQRMKDMPGEGRTFRRRTQRFGDIGPLAPIVDEIHDVIYVDGLHLGRKAVVLVACTDRYVLSGHVAKSEKISSGEALLSRITPPNMVVTDGGQGFLTACKKVGPNTKIQRCIFHVFCQTKRYTTMNPKLPAGQELLEIARLLLHVKSIKQRDLGIDKYVHGCIKGESFLTETTLFEDGHKGYTHERLRSAQSSLSAVLRSGHLFTFLEPALNENMKMPSMNNRIEGDINARLRDMLREHKGMSLIRRIKACFGVCYMHTEAPLSVDKILKVMPTDETIAKEYSSLYYHERNFDSIPQGGDAIVGGEFHFYDEGKRDGD